MRIFSILKEEDTYGKRYNLRNVDFVLPRFKTVAYGRHSLRFLGPQLWAKLKQGGESSIGNGGTSAFFQNELIQPHSLSSVVTSNDYIKLLNYIL